MSLYSGKCDLYDHFMMIGVDENTTEEDIEKEIQKTDFYIHTKDGKRHHLMINNIYDLIPYYPYLIGTGAYSKEHSHIELSQRSFVDSEEDEIMSWKMNDLKKMWRKCKRLGVEFNFDYVKEKQGDYLTTDPNYKRLVELIMDKGDKTELNDIYAANIHSRISEYYRNELYETMISSGYSEVESYYWCFGDFVIGKDKMKRLKNKKK